LHKLIVGTNHTEGLAGYLQPIRISLNQSL
jgi:hypothetical protein